MTWEPSSNLLAQLVHVSLGVGFTLGAKAVGLRWYDGAGSVFLLALGKEVVFDPAVEGQPFYPNGVLDLASYLAGVWMGVMVLGSTGNLD